MSAHSDTTVECPACGVEQTHIYWQSVNVTLDPALKQKLLDRSLVTFTCKKCGHTAEVVQGLLYHDMERALMVSCGDEAPDFPQTDGLDLDSAFSRMRATYTFRLVGSINELIDKILIWEAGLDDRAVEMFKLLLLQQIDESQRGDHPELFFSQIVREPNAETLMAFVLVNESGTTSVAVPFEETFQRFVADVRDRLPASESERGKWLRVDRKYVLQYLDKA